MHGVTMKFVLLYVKQQKDKFEYAWYAVANSRKEITFSLGIWLKAVSTSPLKLELYEELQPASVCVCVCELGSCGWDYGSYCKSYNETLATLRSGETFGQISDFGRWRRSVLCGIRQGVSLQDVKY